MSASSASSLRVCRRSPGTASGWTNGSPSSMCFAGPAPGMTSPSMAVVTKTNRFHTIGDENPRPGTGVDHRTLVVRLHSSGRARSSEIPWPSGPRHCGQVGPKAPSDAPSARVPRAVRASRVEGCAGMATVSVAPVPAAVGGLGRMAGLPGRAAVPRGLPPPPAPGGPIPIIAGPARPPRRRPPSAASPCRNTRRRGSSTRRGSRARRLGRPPSAG